MVWLIARTITITNIIFRYAKIRNYLTQKTQKVTQTHKTLYIKHIIIAYLGYYLLIAIKQKITTFATQK